MAAALHQPAAITKAAEGSNQLEHPQPKGIDKDGGHPEMEGTVEYVEDVDEDQYSDEDNSNTANFIQTPQTQEKNKNIARAAPKNEANNEGQT